MRWKKKYGNKYKYGFSDHTIGSEAAICSIAFGSEYIEKHLTFSKKMYGSDAKFAMEPKEFKKFCESIQKTKKIIRSKVDKNDLRIFRKMKNVFEKKIISKRKIIKGKKIIYSDLDFKKTKKGIGVSKLNSLLGKKIKKTIGKNRVITKSFF